VLPEGKIHRSSISGQRVVAMKLDVLSWRFQSTTRSAIESFPLHRLSLHFEIPDISHNLEKFGPFAGKDVSNR
jgi:hypothetical protein